LKISFFYAGSSGGFGRSGQGVVISDLVLIAAGVMLGAAILLWSLSLTASEQSGYDVGVLQSGSKIAEQFSIDDVYFNSTGMVVYVRNYGDVPVKMVAVYVDGESKSAETVSIAAGGVEAITVDGFVGVSGETYRVRVTSERGNYYEGSFKAP